MLELLAAAAELEQPGADRGVIHAGQVAGQLLVGDPHAGGDRAQLHAHERLVAGAHVGGSRELHVLAGQQHLHGAGLEAGQRVAVGIRRTLAHELVLGSRAQQRVK